MTAIEFINKMIGKTWKIRTMTDEATDCYGLVVMFYRDVLNVKLPFLRYNNSEDFNECYSESHKLFIKIDSPLENCLAVCFTGNNATHIGVIVDGNVLHNREGAGVKYDDLLLLKRLYTKIEYYKYEKN